ncbi:MAG: hypothetical protein AB7N76_21520 [Planctomycetota bacterium]
MGLFRKTDELFELMSKQSGAAGRPGPGLSSSHGRRALETTGGGGLGRRASGSTFRLPRPVSGGPMSDVVEIDGDALIVVDDGWSLPGEGEGPGRTFPIRLDTLVVGGLVCTGLLLAAFLYGRTSASPTGAPENEVAAAAEEPGSQQTEPAAKPEEAPKSKSQTPAPAPSVPASAAKPSAGASSAVAAGMKKGETPKATSVTASAPRPQETQKQQPAAPQQPVKGSYDLVVCSTSADNAGKLVEWLKTNATSPIFGRADLEPYAKGGSVRIRGFAKREDDVLRRVKATHDPLGGSGTFGDAWYRKGS